MEQWTEIRRRVLVEQVSQREILRETGMHWKTLQKILQHSKPPGYRRQVAFTKPKIGTFLDRIRQILEDDRRVPRSQRMANQLGMDKVQAIFALHEVGWSNRQIARELGIHRTTLAGYLEGGGDSKPTKVPTTGRF